MMSPRWTTSGETCKLSVVGFENGKLVRVVMRAVAPSGNSEVNTFHYDLVDAFGFDPNDPQLLADYFRDNVSPKFRALYDVGWTIQPVLVVEEKDPQNPLAPRSEWVSGSGGAGTRTVSGDALAPGHCGVNTFHTAHIGKRFRGRTFLGGTKSEADLIFRTWQTTLVTLWEQYINAIPVQPDIVAGISDSTAKLCVYSRTQRAQDLDPYASAVTGHTVSSALHWLRSRQAI